MAETETETNEPSSRPRPTITLPPRSSMEAIFSGAASPGPMTLVSSFFSEGDPDSEYGSFSQLLAGAMGSPVGVMGRRVAAEESGFVQKQNKGVASFFTIPPGLSPTGLFDSPTLFSPGQSPFGMSHQQALAQVTAQAVQSQSQFLVPVSSMLAPPATSADSQTSYGKRSMQIVNPRSSMVESSMVSYSDQRSQPPPLIVDKPADDGYNWRKYGQKQVKGSEYPRSYYKCTSTKCPVKKKVERSHDGHVTEIIYKGQHNHQPPQNIKRPKDGGNSNGKTHLSRNPEMGLLDYDGNSGKSNEIVNAVSKSKRDQESSQVTPEQLSGSSDGEEVGDAETRANEEDEDQPNPKRRNSEVRLSESVSSQKAVTEPRIIVQTTSEVDLLDDGYRWRKYGQKVVKGNPYPRSYYKCTSAGCNVRKHVERASTDPKAVITTYEGKHNHDVPAAKTSSHSSTNSNVPQMKHQNTVSQKYALVSKMDFGGNNQQSASLQRFKEEGVT